MRKVVHFTTLFAVLTYWGLRGSLYLGGGNDEKSGLIPFLLCRLLSGVRSADYQLDTEILRDFLYGEYAADEMIELVRDAEQSAHVDGISSDIGARC